MLGIRIYWSVWPEGSTLRGLMSNDIVSLLHPHLRFGASGCDPSQGTDITSVYAKLTRLMQGLRQLCVKRDGNAMPASS